MKSIFCILFSFFFLGLMSLEAQAVRRTPVVIQNRNATTVADWSPASKEEVVGTAKQTDRSQATETRAMNPATTIAEAIKPSAEDTVDEFVSCVERLARADVSGEKAIKACQKIAETAANISTRVAKQAANASKNNWRRPRPVVVSNNGYYNNGFGFGVGISSRPSYYSGSYRRPIVRRPPPPRRPPSRRK